MSGGPDELDYRGDIAITIDLAGAFGNAEYGSIMGYNPGLVSAILSNSALLSEITVTAQNTAQQIYAAGQRRSKRGSNKKTTNTKTPVTRGTTPGRRIGQTTSPLPPPASLASAQNSTGDANTQGPTYNQADVQSIADLANSLQSSYNDAQADIAALRALVSQLSLQHNAVLQRMTTNEHLNG